MSPLRGTVNAGNLSRTSRRSGRRTANFSLGDRMKNEKQFFSAQSPPQLAAGLSANFCAFRILHYCVAPLSVGDAGELSGLRFVCGNFLAILCVTERSRFGRLRITTTERSSPRPFSPFCCFLTMIQCFLRFHHKLKNRNEKRRSLRFS